MTEPDLYRVLLLPLHATGVQYMITGSVAAIAYGEPRMTNDVDVVLWLGPGDSGRLIQTFPPQSYDVRPVEVIEQERQRRRFGHFNILHLETALRADVYVAGDDPLHAWAFERRRSESMSGGAVWFAPAEYVIVRKLEYYRHSGSDRHLRDIAGMLRISAGSIDLDALHQLVSERGLTELWSRVTQH